MPRHGVIATAYNGLTIKIGNQTFIQDQKIDVSSSAVQTIEKLENNRIT